MHETFPEFIPDFITIVSTRHNQFCIGSNSAQNMSSVNGTVNTVVKNGSTYYVGGNFSYVGLRTGGAALLSATNDYPDMNFPGVQGAISCSADDGSGGWFLGGTFIEVNGVNHYGLIHVKSDKSIDTNWHLETNSYSSVYTLTRSGDTLFMGGTFSSIGSTNRISIATIKISTQSVLNWNPIVDGTVNTFWSKIPLFILAKFCQSK
ncbi:MAG: hypothetical protein IPP51_03365 [Bacteroidetes bacterium]|nr:hypothetical protein [Bacteroidota bacterium]